MGVLGCGHTMGKLLTLSVKFTPSDIDNYSSFVWYQFVCTVCALRMDTCEKESTFVAFFDWLNVLAKDCPL